MILAIWIFCAFFAWLVALWKTENILRSFAVFLLGLMIGPPAIWAALVMENKRR